MMSIKKGDIVKYTGRDMYYKLKDSDSFNKTGSVGVVTECHGGGFYKVKYFLGYTDINHVYNLEVVKDHKENEDKNG